MHAIYKKQEKHAKSLNAGDKVAYSALFLKSTQLGHDTAKMRGVISQIGGRYPEGFTNSEGESLAGEYLLSNFCLVQWDKGPLKMINIFNLAKVKSAAFAGV